MCRNRYDRHEIEGSCRLLFLLFADFLGFFGFSRFLRISWVSSVSDFLVLFAWFFFDGRNCPWKWMDMKWSFSVRAFSLHSLIFFADINTPSQYAFFTFTIRDWSFITIWFRPKTLNFNPFFENPDSIILRIPCLFWSFHLFWESLVCFGHSMRKKLLTAVLILFSFLGLRGISAMNSRKPLSWWNDQTAPETRCPSSSASQRLEWKNIPFLEGDVRVSLAFSQKLFRWICGGVFGKLKALSLFGCVFGVEGGG